MTKRFQNFGDKFQMRDGAFPINDTVLNGKTRITTGMRIEPEPAPRVVPGQMGVIWTGVAGDGSGRVPTQIDIDNAVQNVDDLVGGLTPAQKAKMQATLARFSGSANRTSEVGITSNDAAQNAVAQSTAGVAQINAISDANRSFWDKRLEESQRIALGR